MPVPAKLLSLVAIVVVLVLSTGFTGGGTRPAELDDFRHRAFANPSRIVDVAFGTSGVLGELTVDRGAIVEAGQILGRLESGVEEVDLAISTERATSPAAVDRAQAALDLAELRLASAQQLHTSDVMTAEQLDERRTEFELARAALVEARFEQRVAQLQRDRARAVVERRQLKSPVAGVVTEVFFDVGERIEATETSALAQVAVVDPLRAEFLFDAESLGEFSVGDSVSLRFFAPVVAEPVAGTVTVVDSIVDAASQTFRVRVEIGNSGGKIPAGLECEIVRDAP